MRIVIEFAVITLALVAVLWLAWILMTRRVRAQRAEASRLARLDELEKLERRTTIARAQAEAAEFDAQMAELIQDHAKRARERSDGS